MASYISTSKKTKHKKAGAITETFGLVSIFLITMGIIGEWYEPSAPYENAIKEMKAGRSFKNPSIIIGPSHAKAISKKSFLSETVEIWTGGQDISTSYQYIKAYKQDLNRINKTIRVISPGEIATPVPMRQDYTADKIQWALDPVRFIKDGPNHTFQTFITLIFSSIAREDNWALPMKKILLGDVKAKLSPAHAETQADPFDVGAALNRIHTHLNRMAAPHVTTHTIQKNLLILDDILRISEEKNGCFLLVESPVSNIYKKYMFEGRPELIHWKKFIRGFVEEHAENCVYFLEDIWPTPHADNPIYYSDSDHLNEVGAEVFTRLLLQRMREMGLE